MTTIRTILALTTSQGLSLQQMDVNNAFLHGNLKEEIYISLPPSMVVTPSSKVCRLHQYLYGLK
jgi:hypothetical protein